MTFVAAFPLGAYSLLAADSRATYFENGEVVRTDDDYRKVSRVRTPLYLPSSIDGRIAQVND